MKTYLLYAFALTILSSDPAHGFGGKPVAVPGPVANPLPTPPTPTGPVGVEASCPAAGTVQAVDLSSPVNQHFLDVMKQLRVNTVIRYYDHPNETLRGKTLLPGEVDLLARNGFDVMVVFQHNNNQLSTFTTSRGVADASRSLALAKANGQRAGSAIYFGVDGGWSAARDLAAIQAYFGQAGALVRAGGFKVGAYGDGVVCSQLLKAGAVDYCWLANAKGWPGYQSFSRTQEWVLEQKLPQNCGGLNVDFDVANVAKRDLGQFRP